MLFSFPNSSQILPIPPLTQLQSFFSLFLKKKHTKAKPKSDKQKQQ